MDTEGLRQYMSKFGPLDDCVVMKVDLFCAPPSEIILLYWCSSFDF